MRKLGLVAVALVISAVTIPGNAASTQPVGCSGKISPGGSASCVVTFNIPHFRPTDAIDYDTLVARIVSPQATNWKVHAKIADAKGRVYFAWECVVARSVVVANSSSYTDRTCAAWRRTINDDTNPSYYTASTKKAQVLTVTAWVGSCAPGTKGCRFEAAANYRFS